MSIKIKQRDITDCGAACLVSVASHYKLKLAVAKIRQKAGTDKKGTNVLGLLKAAENLGFAAKGVKGGVDALTKIPLPTIAHIVVKEQLHHYVVIYSVKKGVVKYMDPGDGRMHKKTITEFEKEWTGVLVLLMPNDDFKKGNEQVSNFKRFMFLLKPHRSLLTQALFGAIIYTLLGLSTSIYIQKITDFVIVDGNTNLLNMLSVAMVVILLLQIFIGVAKSIFMLKTGQK